MSGLPSPEICQRILALWVVLGEPDWTETDRLRLINLLIQHGQSVSDLPRIFHTAGVIAAPSRPKDKLYERIWRLFCHLNVDDKPIREEARKKLDEFLNKHKLEWNGANGFTAILVVYWVDNNNISAGNAASQTTTDDEQTFTVLDFLLVLFEDYMAMSPNYRMIAALWALHVHHYREFEVTPRLLLVSPGSGYGKTTLLHMLKEFVADPHLTKNTTAPAMYRRLERKPRTCYLLDEAENQGILTDRVMRALLDAGYEGGGSIDRADGEFPVHFPCATAIRGYRHDVPLAHLSRSLTLVMEKGLPNKRFNKTNPGPEFPYARERIEKWNATVAFNPDPEIPAVLFDGRDVGRMPRKVLAKAVPEQDDYFSDWRGSKDSGTPHELTSGELSRLLKPLAGKARSMRIGKDKDGKDKWDWCYTRTQIEAAWRTHCSENHDTATQTSNVIALARPSPTQT